MSENSEQRSSDPAASEQVSRAGGGETFAGYDLESGVLQRVRQWRDAIPALVLIDALRVAGSPLHVGLFWVAWSALCCLPDGHSIDFTASGLPRFDFQGMGKFPWRSLVWAASVIGIGIFPAALAARAGACYAAGRMQSFTENGRVTLARWLRLLVIPMVPLAITMVLSSLMVAAGALGRISGIGSIVVEATAIAVLPIAILIGLIAGGAVAAVPLAITAVVLEKQSDVLDSLSRGYEYLFRRPVYLAFYGLCAFVLVAIVWQLAAWVVAAALSIGGWGLRIGSGEAAAPQWFQWLLGRLPWAVANTAAWGQVGAIYLLMRKAANDQEIEDIAISPLDTSAADMPTLRPEI
jgi:hypothetical protein